MTGRILAVTGTSTDVGKTVATAALAAVARGSVAVCKPVQTGMPPGEPGDLAAVESLAGPVTTAECARYPEPLAPETAARRAGAEPVALRTIVDTVAGLAGDHDLTLVEGAGGVLVRLAENLTLLDVAGAVAADVVVVVQAGLGALNHAELTVDAIRAHGLTVAGLVIGSWPAEPDLAMICNRDDLPRLTGVPVIAVIPAGAGSLTPDEFRAAAPTWFDPEWAAAHRDLHRDPAVGRDPHLDPRGRRDSHLDPRGRSDEGARVTRGPATRPPDPTRAAPTTTAPAPAPPTTATPTDHPTMTGVPS
ncbi:ATP-dependent dethiobiotin synthetase BioD [Gordonia amarae]|mgnify:CR=1 FL=1|uniref:ATP-dependent dethiobiotin synthetase BioD n=2 Tax=Gordonia amarae TaxID=36821 RepID=G7GRX2_9ACTN|nr:dethiobiotin synthetase [Gordonia amarae]GAB06347.1 ATP-dependent dethiobiotin synthetase BioD [Gordonia amarae NBRC 15530]QHN17993.1 ATP-dependent dethiobiotin synthetase BioD [Gordonia amarae]QHN22513.1 ATP-dependent dethiobiotin synthetase BioD [Gordonia amarae]QHN31378.1 ATP-dependent dethiobiotin synthetase BioD [Gordonia amarae]